MRERNELVILIRGELLGEVAYLAQNRYIVSVFDLRTDASRSRADLALNLNVFVNLKNSV